MSIVLTVYQGRVGDHNDLAMPGAVLLANAIGARLDLEPVVLGTPEPALNAGWKVELAAAAPGLRDLQAHLDELHASGQTSIAVLNRCATSLATLPVVARHFPGSVVVWFDAHADLNTPEGTETGYLGGLPLAAVTGLWDSGFGAGYTLDQLVLVGQRSIDPFEAALIAREGVAVIEPGPNLNERVAEAIAGRPAFVHIDCDVLDPSLVPTDYRIPDGLSFEDLRSALATIAEGPVLGLEVTEFQVSFTPGGPPATTEAGAVTAALEPILAKLTGATSR